MDIEIKRNGGAITAFLSGRMDTPAASEAAAVLLPLQEEDAESITLDCTDLSYISSSGLRIFLALRKASAEKGWKLVVKNINDSIRNVFMMTGFLNLFQII